MESIDMFSWYALKLVLWAGPFGVGAFLATIAGASFAAGYFFDPVALRLKRSIPMGAAKLDHIKYDILPDGTLGPGDNRGLEDLE
jgi:hypothetical protein